MTDIRGSKALNTTSVKIPLPNTDHLSQDTSTIIAAFSANHFN
jgi:hypothetical protein